MWFKLKRWLVGNPLPSQQEHHERLAIPLALAVFASDALSSTAYATEEMLLAFVGTAYASVPGLMQALSLPVGAAIILLMAAVVLSYRQVIETFPSGGGSYEVASSQLGPTFGQIAGAALLIDYVLTVAVSISAGVSALTSPGWVHKEDSVLWALGFILLMTLINLRGVKESGRVFAFPAYTFIAIMMALIGYGLFKAFTGESLVLLSNWQAPFVALASPPAATEASKHLPSLLGLPLVLALLNSFSHGCTALTGIEAISNGVQAFKEPVAKNANTTMVLMAIVLGGIFIGMSLLAFLFQVPPSHSETLISQIGRLVFGNGSWLYVTLQAVTMVILILAANTSFAGFPRLAKILADDGYLPRQLKSLGDRLVFSNGILFLGLLSALLVWVYHADTHALIPLYAIGVFLSFTLAQWGMVKHHQRSNNKHKGWGMAINLFGAALTSIVTVLLAVEKFTAGAWIILVAIPVLVLLFRTIQNHYTSIGRQLTLPVDGYKPQAVEHTVLLLVSSLHRGTLPALEYAKSLSGDVEAVHVELNPASTERLKAAWEEWGSGVPLTVLKSPYRSIMQPMLDYVDVVEARREHDVVTVIIPEFVTKKFWHNLLHNQTSLLIKTLLRFKPGTVVTTVRYYLEE